MAPIKFEERIKEELEQRRLEPSDAAWKTLARKLDAGSQKKKGNKIWWFGIAASMIGVFIILNQMFRVNELTPVHTIPAVVTSENDAIEPKIDKKDVSNDNALVETEESKDKFQLSNNRPEVDPVDKPTTTINSTTIANKVRNNSQKMNKNIIADPSIQSQELDNGAMVLENQNDSSMALTDNGEEELQAKLDIDLEVESLLSDAITETTKTNESIKVDPDALLESVETEMPPSIRRQVFKLIEKNYKTVKTAVVTRNK